MGWMWSAGGTLAAISPSLPPSQDSIACCLRHGGTGGHDRMEQNSASFGMRKLALLHSVVVKFPVADAIKNILVLN